MDDLKAALSALTNRKVKVDFPNIDGIYVKPLPMRANLELLADVEGDTDQDKVVDLHMATLAYCMVDKDGKQIYSKDEFKKFYDSADATILEPYIKAVHALNDFSGKPTEVKKK